METDVLDVYDPGSDSWETLGELPAVRVGAAGAVLDGSIYHLGGIVGDALSATVDVYDVGSESWSSAPDMPREAGSAAAAALPDRIVSVGGEPDDQYLIEAGDPVLDPRNAWALDPDFSGWEVIADQSVFREGAVAVGHGGRAYVFGGSYRGPGGESVILETVERWDAEADAWEPLTPMPAARANACGALVGDTIYVAGGAFLDDHDSKRSDRVFAYRPAFDTGPGVETTAPDIEAPPPLEWVVASDGDFTDRVALEWHDGGTGFGYTVWRAQQESGPFCMLWDTEDMVTTYEDAEVEPGVTYWYRVSYYDEAVGEESELSPGDSGFAAN
jgi:N-acetylneuraminic acid mutarotase